jgi:uncharacterized repeat protein (TIGR01451 family)
MSNQDSIRTRIFFFLIVQLLVLLVAVAVVSAASQEPAQAPGSTVPGAAYALPSAPTTPSSPSAIQATEAATLEVSILSSPWATLDNNDPTGDKGGKPVPKAFVIQAVVTNTGETAAEALTVTLDYSDTINNWVLLEGEDAVRQFREPLGPGESHHIYWFATYSTTVGASFQYTVTAEAGNADPVSTSDNYYGNPEPGKTVKTLGALNTGSTGILSTTAEILVGAPFTVTVNFDLSTNPERAIFSPVGNLDFDPGSYRLLETEVSFYDDIDALLDTVPDRLYFPAGSLHISATRALMAYTFVAYTPGHTRLCPYTTVSKSNTDKYGNDFCTDPTIIPITSTVSLSLTKQVTALDIQQGESLTYTISYTNSGGEKLGSAWIWDDVDPDIGSIVSTSGAPDVLTEHRAAWYVNDIPPSGNPGSTGTFTLSVHIDGGGQDLADQTDVVNHAFFGIDPGTVPAEPALTSTVTTTVQAPAITIAKTDGLETVQAGDELTYTLHITNSGSVTATGVVITDYLPSGVSHPGGPVLTWDLDPLPPDVGTDITVPVTVTPILPDGTVLTNTMMAEYQNAGGYWTFDPVTAKDTTTVRAPFWFLTKTDQPDPVLAGEVLTYTLEYNHNGVVPAQDVSITDTLPVDVTYGGIVSQSAAWDPPTYVPGPPATLTWVTPTLVSGVSGTLVFTVTVHPDAGSPLANEVVLSSTDPATDTTDIEYTTVQREADLAIAKTDDPNPVVAGTALTYTLVITNYGPSDDASVAVTDTLPAGVTFDSYAASQGTFDDATGQWSVGYLAAGESTTLTLLVTVDPDTTGTLLNSADVSGNETDPVPGNNSASTETEVTTQADLAIDKAVSPTLLPAGATLTYTVTYDNYGPSDAQTIQITDTMSAKVAFGGVVSATPPLADPQVDGNQLTWSVPTLSAVASGTIVYTVTASPAAVGIISNTVVITSTTPETNITNNEASTEALIGDPTRATIYGYVFEDTNGDGLWDDGEPPIAGVLITLNGADTTTTDQDGQYLFIVAEPGIFTVVETDPDGYFSTTPNEIHMSVELGSSYRADFGDAPNDSPFAAIYGTVFEDPNGNGLWDGDEVGIEGVTVTLDDTTSTTTNPYGSYTFSTASEAVHTVVETDADGYFSTTPNEVHVEVVLGEGHQVDFGDAPNDSPFAAIYGTVFEDGNSDGQWDNDELGIEAVTVTLSGDGTTTTNPYGSYTLSTTQATLHTVVETDPDGYMSTTPNEVSLEVELGHGYQVDFGDVAFCTCPGDEYEEDDEWVLATELTAAVTQTHNFCDDPTDWILLDVQAGFVYTITTHSWGQRADTVLHLYDIDAGTGDQTLLASSDDYESTDDYSSRILWVAPLGGSDVYYVRVTSRGGLTGCETDYDIGLAQEEYYYLFLPIITRNFSPNGLTDQGAPAIESGADQPLELTISESPSTEPEIIYSPAGTITHECEDVFEVDDTWEQAKPIGDGELQVHSFDSNPVVWLPDKDFVWFYLQAGRTITFTVPAITGTWEVQLMLYDQNGDPMPETATLTGQLVWQAETAGLYYLAVSPPEAAGIYGCADVAGYKLRAEFEPRWYLYLPIVTRQVGTP